MQATLFLVDGNIIPFYSSSPQAGHLKQFHANALWAGSTIQVASSVRVNYLAKEKKEKKKKVSKRVISMGKYVYDRKVQILMSLGVER